MHTYFNHVYIYHVLLTKLKLSAPSSKENALSDISLVFNMLQI